MRHTLALGKKDILVDCQHGFRKKLSTETQLIITTDYLAAIINKHSQADVADLDLSKAFEKVHLPESQQM